MAAEVGRFIAEHPAASVILALGLIIGVGLVAEIGLKILKRGGEHE